MQNTTLITGDDIFIISVFSSFILLEYPCVISIKDMKLSELPDDK